MHRIVFIVFFAAFSSAHAQTSDTLKQIDALFTRWHNATPGGVVTVSRNDQIVYNKAFGLADLEHNVPNKTETIFEAGSVSKQFTAISILLLSAEGKLSLQDDVHKYVPELPQYNTTITIQHLLNHTSGLKDWGSIGGLAGWPRTTRVYTQDLALQIICKQKSLNFTPGSEYSYSNSNYSLLVTIVERVSKQSLAEFTRTRLFEPTGMTHTQWRDNFREVIPNRAVAYSKSGDEFRQNMPFENVHGHGGLLTTTSDLLKWNKILETRQIGGDQVAALRIKKGKLNNGKEIRYAAGLFIDKVNGLDEIAHSGATAGYRAWLAYYPQKKLSIAILSNDAGFGPQVAGRQIAEIFLGKEETKERDYKFVFLPEADLKKWSGTYRLTRGFDVFSLEYKEGKLSSNGYALNAIHQDTLYIDRLKFISTEPGRILLHNPAGDTGTYVHVNPPDPKSFQELSGKYYSEEAETTFNVEVKEGKVLVHQKPATSFELSPSFKDAFLNEYMELYEFIRDRKGRITGLLVSVSRAENISFVKIVNR